MSDVREANLARMLALINVIDGFKTIARNVDVFNDDELPAISLIDGDEARIDQSPSLRSSMRPNAPLLPQLMEMGPVILIASGARNPEDLGSDLSKLRARVIPAILTDATLAGFANYGMRYERMETPRTETGRQLLSHRALHFSLRYMLRPGQL